MREKHYGNCAVCSAPLPPYLGGRPRTYCGGRCRKLAEYARLRQPGAERVAELNRIMNLPSEEFERELEKVEFPI